MTEINDEPIREYVLMMLGSPVVKIELTDEQTDLCISTARTQLNSMYKMKSCTCKPNSEQETMLLKSGALIYAKVILGRIRGKFAQTTQPISYGWTACSPLDAERLVKEHYKELIDWKSEVLAYCGFTNWESK